MNPRVSIVSLGCSRNDVDSEELAGRLVADGWDLTNGDQDTDVVLVNTCGFIEQAKKDSIDALLEVADAKEQGKAAKVVAVGCLAQRYGKELADELPEADAVLGFDHYGEIGKHLRDVMAGTTPAPPIAGDRRLLLPLAPVERTSHQGPLHRARLDSAPWAPLKIASGCDRRCTFCAIPAFRGAYVSRAPQEVLAEARWLAENGVRELMLVSENSTSYGKDLGDLRMLEQLLPALAGIEGVDRVRAVYLQPAEVRPDLIRVITQTPGVAPYLDLSFQHASPAVLRRMKRFGGSQDFLAMLEAARVLNPQLGARTNVIVGFPGETEQDIAILEDFIVQARLDVVGVFGYSDEDGTAALHFDGKLSQGEIDDRVAHISAIAGRVADDVASSRVGQTVSVLIEGEGNLGRSLHQGPEVDGCTVVLSDEDFPIGTIVSGEVIGADGIDLVAQV